MSLVARSPQGAGMEMAVQVVGNVFVTFQEKGADLLGKPPPVFPECEGVRKR